MQKKYSRWKLPTSHPQKRGDFFPFRQVRRRCGGSCSRASWWTSNGRVYGGTEAGRGGPRTWRSQKGRPLSWRFAPAFFFVSFHNVFFFGRYHVKVIGVEASEGYLSEKFGEWLTFDKNKPPARLQYLLFNQLFLHQILVEKHICYIYMIYIQWINMKMVIKRQTHGSLSVNTSVRRVCVRGPKLGKNWMRNWRSCV